MKITVSVIVPALNEEAGLQSAIKEIILAMGDRFSSYEIIIFDDSSTDKTGIIADELAKKNRSIRVIHNKTTMGLGYNYKKGVELAKKEFVTLFPGDNEIISESMRDMFNLAGKADMIIPYLLNPEIRPLSRQIISVLFTATINLLFGLNLKYYNGPVIHKSKIIKSVNISTYGFAYQAEILTKLIRSGHSFTEIGMKIRKRKGGGSKIFKLKNITSVLKTIIGLFFVVYIKDRKKYNKKIRRIKV